MKSRLILVVLTACIAAAATLAVARRSGSNRDSAGKSAEPEAVADDSLVVISPERQQAAAVKTATAEKRAIQTRVTVPGRLQYDDTRHVELRATVSGIVTDIFVKPGDHVDKGAILAAASSPEIGQARSEILKRQDEFDLASQRKQWADQIVKGIEAVVGGISEQKPAEEIRKETAESSLGEYREKLMTAYSRYWLAGQLNSKLSGAVDAGAIARRTALERQSEEETAQSALQAAIEQSRYDGKMQAREAEILAADARRRLELARQTLKAILGPGAGDNLGERGEDLAKVEIRAPFEGEIERRTCTVSERVDVGASLFVLADPSQLWVSAEVREQEWEASALTPGCRLRVTVPALNQESYDAELYYVGREVSRDAHSLPIMGRLDNSKGRLRPGLFVQVELPVGEAVQKIVVPSEAVQTHEGRPVVFVEEAEGRYRRREVKTGASVEGWTEVKAGIAAGERVVSEGAFLLKSEQLLEGERE
jgi:cobalt-zinc-cadmium efflux system membrane fusion protein